MHTPSPIGSGRPCNSQPRKALSFPAAPVPDPQNEILSPRHLLLSDPSWGLAGLDAPEPNPVKALWTGWPPGKDAQEQQMSSPPSFAPTFRLSCAHPPFSHDSSSRDQAFDGPLQRRRARAPPPRRPLSKAIPSPCTIWDPIWSNVGSTDFASDYGTVNRAMAEHHNRTCAHPVPSLKAGGPLQASGKSASALKSSVRRRRRSAVEVLVKATKARKTVHRVQSAPASLIAGHQMSSGQSVLEGDNSASAEEGSRVLVSRAPAPGPLTGPRAPRQLERPRRPHPLPLKPAAPAAFDLQSVPSVPLLPMAFSLESASQQQSLSDPRRQVLSPTRPSSAALSETNSLTSASTTLPRRPETFMSKTPLRRVQSNASLSSAYSMAASASSSACSSPTRFSFSSSSSTTSSPSSTPASTPAPSRIPSRRASLSSMQNKSSPLSAAALTSILERSINSESPAPRPRGQRGSGNAKKRAKRA